MRPASAALASEQYALHFRPELHSREQWAEAIERIGAHSHPSVAMTLAPLTIVSDTLIANTAVRVLYDVLMRLDEEGILWMGRLSRQFDIIGSPLQDAWRFLQPRDVDQFKEFGEKAVALFCVGSNHSNGHVRQACVEALANYPGRLSMAFLLLRINDWVRPVRAYARIAMMGRLLQARQGDVRRAEELFENLILTDRIEQWHRDDHKSIRDAIAATVICPAFEIISERGLEDKRARLQLRMHKLVLERRGDAPYALLRHAMNSRNGTIRIWGAREALRRLSGSELRSLVDSMQKDSLATIRYEAVFALATKLPPVDSNSLIPFLCDTSADVRFLAAYYLEKMHFDVRKYYLDTLSAGHSHALAAIVAGLGERGKTGDESRLNAFLRHSDPHVRRATLFTIGKLRKEGDVQWLLDALQDEHKIVVREAARQIEQRIHIIDVATMENWLHSETRLSMRREALRIGAKMERWQALGFLLRAALIEEPTLRRDVERELDRWLQRFIDWYSPPNLERIEELENAYAAARWCIDGAVLARIRWNLDRQIKLSRR